MAKLLQCTLIQAELALAFDDGVELYLPLDQLRAACPCAACQGEPDALGRVVRPQRQVGAGGTTLRKWVPVGGYALQLYWGDGHSSGIYSFDYLRSLAA